MPSSSGCGVRDVERVPAHVRDLQARVGRRDAVDLAGDPAEALGVTSYSRPRSAISCMPTQMPRNGRPFSRTASSSASTMPGTASSPRRQSAKAPTPGSTTRSAARDRVGIAGHDDRLVEAGLARGALEGLRRRVQIAGAVIDDGDAHRVPPGSGKRPMTLDDGGGRGMARRGRRARRRRRRGRSDVSPETHAPRRRRTAARPLRDRSPLTTPTFFQPRRASVQRRTCSPRCRSAARRRPRRWQGRDRKRRRNAARPRCPRPRRRRASSTSHSRCHSIHRRRNRNAQNRKPIAHERERAPDRACVSAARSGGSWTV